MSAALRTTGHVRDDHLLPCAGEVIHPDEFEVAIHYPGGHAVLDIRGEVDLLTAPELGSILNALIDRGHRRIVCDLAGTTFMDAAGLGTLAIAAARLGPLGGVLAVRSASEMIERLFTICGLSTAIPMDNAIPAIAHVQNRGV